VRFLRGLLGGLAFILACLLGLLGAVACLTIILLPVGIPLLMLARRLVGKSMRLFMPQALAHPTKEPRRRGRKARKATGKLGRKARRKMAKATPDVEIDTKGAMKKPGKLLGRKRRRLV